MNQKEMVDICKSYGYDFSIPKIYRYGFREGFLVKTSETGRERYTVIESKFREWLNKGKIPEGYASFSEYVKKFNIPFQMIKYHLIKNNKEILKLGIGGENLFYAKRADIESVITEYHKRTKKEKSND